MPKDFPSLVYLSMVLQAEGIRYGVEHWRRNRERVAGALYWQLNDCWPVASWSSIDYHGRWKALHYAARRFFAPVLLSIEDEPPAFGLYVTSDLCEPWEGTVRWSLVTFDGDVREAGEEVVAAPPLQSTLVRTLDFAGRVSHAGLRRTLLVAELLQGNRRIALAVATFVPSKHLELADPGLVVEVSQEDGDLCCDVTARSLARFVEVSLEGADVVFSDNYVDLPAGRSARVSCPLPEGWTLERAHAALRVRSLRDSYA
jgi:beta-mannosidase